MGGHPLVSSGSVQLGEDPHLLCCDPFPNELIRTELYPRLTATEAIPALQGTSLCVVDDVVTAGVKVKALLMDAEFTAHLELH